LLLKIASPDSDSVALAALPMLGNIVERSSRIKKPRSIFILDFAVTKTPHILHNDLVDRIAAHDQNDERIFEPAQSAH
jgi:hypothetical protein